MTIEHRIDEAARRVTVVLGPRDTAAASTRLILRLVTERPALKSWDWVHDVREAGGHADLADTDAVAAAFAGEAAAPCWTVFVSLDRHLALWCQVMDHQIPGRRHLTAPTLEQAYAALDARRAAAGPPRAS